VSTLFIVWCLGTHAYNPAIEWMARWVGPWAMTELAQARVFWFDWLFGLAVAAHFLGARALVARFGLRRIAKPIRWCAGISFAAYLLHPPILTLTAAFLPKTAGITGIILTLLAIAVLGPPIERSKHQWRRYLTVQMDWIISFASKRGGSAPRQA
jgi:peptidoglycan/LPS O-acetylase OafA/YrhL